jgi:uncharacterized protein YegL
MGGKSGGKPKMRVTRYYLAMHLGICHSVEAIKAIWVGEKKAWCGNAAENGAIGVGKEGLFGGMQKEGGASGRITVMLGGDTQTAPPSLIQRLGTTASTTPGFRGITSLFFYGAGESAPADFNWGGLFGAVGLFGLVFYKGRSFYWGTQPYLKPVWVTVERIPARALAPGTAPIPRGSSDCGKISVYMELDDSASMTGARLANLKSAVNTLLDAIVEQIGQGRGFDVGMSRFNGGKIERTGVNASDIQDLRNFVGAIVAFGRTPFDAPIADAVTWFEASRNNGNLVRRINFFITDGAPAPGSDDTAASIASELLDRTIPVDMYGINIDKQNTSATAKLDNTPWDGVPVVSGGNAQALADIFAGALLDIFDANPAHVIYECLTDTDWGMGADPAGIDTASFQAASVTLYDEVFGVFLQWQAQSTIQEFVNDVLDHIRGATYPDPRTGQIALKLLRDDLDVPNLKTITPDNATLISFARKGWGETVNEVVITWTNPDTEKEETVFAQDLANIAIQGGVVSSSKNYHGIRTRALAAQVAERDLREESAPLSSCEVEVNREFWDVTPFDGMKVTWPEFGLDELVMRVMKVDYGDSQSSVIKLSLVEDVFSLAMATYVEPAAGEWVDPAAPPIPVTQARLMPPPAYAVSNYGTDPAAVVYPSTGAVPLATNPTTDGSAQFDVLREVATPSGGTTFQTSGSTRDFPARATLPAELIAAVTSTGVLLDGLTGIGPVVEDLLLIGDDALPNEEMELALVTAVDGTTGALTLLRGALDTVPVTWPLGTLVQATPLAMWQPLPIELIDGQTVTLKFLTSTGQGMLEDYDAPEFIGTAQARPDKPTRAANVKINGHGVETPDLVLDSPEVVLTWSHRNRLLEDAVMYAWDAASLPVEAGTTYTVTLFDETDAQFAQQAGLTGETWTSLAADELALGFLEAPYSGIFTYSGTLPTPGARFGSTVTARLATHRDGVDAWQDFEITGERAGYGYGYGNHYGGPA